MRRVLIALLLGLWAAPAAAQAISHVNNHTAGNVAVYSDGTEEFTLGWTPAANSLVCALAGNVVTGITSVTGLGGTWTEAITHDSSNIDPISMFCTRDGTGSGTTVTINTGVTASSNVRTWIVEFSQSGGAGFDAPNEHVASAGANADASPHTSGSTTPTDANNVCIGGLAGTSGTYTVPAGWTNVTVFDASRSAYGYLIQTSATAGEFAVTSPASEDYNAIIACVDSPASGGGGSTAAKNCLLIGVCE